MTQTKVLVLAIAAVLSAGTAMGQQATGAGDCAQRDAAGNCIPLVVVPTDPAAPVENGVRAQDTTATVPARAHKDDGVKYRDRTTDQTSGNNGGATASDDDGATGGTATHVRGDGNGGGVGGNMGPSN